MLQERGVHAVLVEPGPQGVANAVARGVHDVILGSFEDAGFRPGSLPSTGLFDVLEHIEDDVSLLKHIYEATQPGGTIYLTVPAYRWLWSHEDEFGGHYRRYTARSMSRVLAAAGFTPVYASYFFALLPLPIWLARTLPSRLGLRKSFNVAQASQDHGNRALEMLLKLTAGFERRRIRNAKQIPFGGSVMAVGRKVS
jgi:hypothetical protein